MFVMKVLDAGNHEGVVLLEIDVLWWKELFHLQAFVK
jgi:hypothetical protein